jgi:O-antigen ligase
MVIFLFIISQLGYIPGLPYWLYNISIFVTIPIFTLVLLFFDKIKFTHSEILFLFIFFCVLFLSNISSPFEFSVPGFLRAVVPLIYYYLVRALKVGKSKEYYNLIIFSLFISFFVALYQILFQPIYFIEDGVWHVYAEDVFWLVKRPVSYLGNANVFGVFCVLCFIIIFFDNPYLLSRKKKYLIFIVTIINIVVFAKSRTALLAFIIVNLVYLIKNKKYKILLIFTSLIITFSIFLFANYDQYSFLNDIFRLSSLYEDDDNSYTIRKRIAEFTVNLIFDRPLFGVGVGNEQLLMRELNAPHKGSESASLLILVERGLFGYIIYLSLIFFQFLFTGNNFPKMLIGFVILSVDFTETVFVLPQLTSYLAIYLGVCKNEMFNNNKILSSVV